MLVHPDSSNSAVTIEHEHRRPCTFSIFRLFGLCATVLTIKLTNRQFTMKATISPTIAAVTAVSLLALSAQPAYAQINLEHVQAAPKEERVPMPHIDPDDPGRMKIQQDDSTDIWRTERDYSQYPNRDPGVMNIQRYALQMEPVGIKTFFQQPVALTPEDLTAAGIDVALQVPVQNYAFQMLLDGSDDCAMTKSTFFMRSPSSCQ